MLSYRVLVLTAISSFYFVARMAFATNPAICNGDAEVFFQKNPKAQKVFICGSIETEQFCRIKTNKSCIEVDVSLSLKTINTTHKWDDPNTKKMAQAFQRDQSPRKKILATYLARLNLKKNIFMRPFLSIQTGRYPLVSVSKQALNAKCMTAIVQAAYRLNSVFPNYNFVVDSHIHNCHNLREGIKEVLANQDRVRHNLKRFHSPLHSIYLTNETKYVSQELGKMGLYINVDLNGEIHRRLVRFDRRNVTERKLATNNN